MNWSRAKTILIALLLAVNVFLLVTYITRENAVRRDEMTVRTDVCRILAAHGIEVAEDIIPLDSVEIRPAMIRESADLGKVAERLFGEVTEENSGGSVAYFGEGGSIMFSNDAFSLVYESGKSVLNSGDAEALARSIASKLSVSTSTRDFSCVFGDGGYTVKVPQVLSGVSVFNCGIEFKISESGSVIASGKFIGNGRLVFTDGEVIRTSALLLSFADGVGKGDVAPLKVSAMSLGYISKTPAAGRVSLSPTIELATDKGMFYVDMQTGRLVKI